MLNPYIKTFVKVAGCGSFSSAAEQLYISKVSVMNQINSLESHIGVPLFERTHHGVALSAAGQAFYKSAEKMLRLSENAIYEARKIGGASSKNIRIGTSLMRPCNALIDLWETISGGNQEYRFSIVTFSDGADSLNAILSNLGTAIDCVVTPCGSTRLLANYNFLPLGACKCAVALSKKNPLAKKEVLRWEDLEGNTLLLVRQGDSYVLDELRDDILVNHKTIQIVDSDGFYDMSTFNLCEQQGYLMETLDLWSNLHPSLVTIPVKWKYEMPYGIMYARDPTDHVKAFIDSLAKARSSRKRN